MMEPNTADVCDAAAAAASAQRVTKRNARIMECQDEIKSLEDELDKLQAERRREILLASFEHKPEHTWAKLTEEERQDKDIVIKAAACGALGATRYCHHGYGGGYAPPSPEMLADRDVILALVARKDFAEALYNDMFDVPESLRNDKEVMMAVCAKNSKAFRLALPELRDDPELVMTTLEQEAHYSKAQLQFASDRLRSDKVFILDILARIEGGEGQNFIHNYDFLEYITPINVQEEKEIALALLMKCIECKHSTSDKLCYFSSELRDDKDTMLKFIEADPGALAHCSDRLKGCEDVVRAAATKNENTVIYTSKAVQDKVRPNLLKDKKSVIQSIVENGLEFDAIPDEMKDDEDILEAAIIELGAKIFRDLPPQVRQSKRLFYAAASVWEYDPPSDFFDLIPDIWRKDEDFLLKILERDFDWPEMLLDYLPPLYQSKKAMMMIAGHNLDDDRRLSAIMKKSPFTDDKDVMMRACETDSDCIEVVSSRLLSDREFVSDLISKAKDTVVLLRLSDDFKRNNVDLVIRAIEMHDSSRVDEMLVSGGGESVLSCVWDQKDVVTSCLKKGSGVGLLEALHYESPGSSFLDDEEIVTLAVKNQTDEFQYASTRLKTDRDFVLSLLHMNLSILEYCADVPSLIHDDELLLAAIVADTGAILKCFPAQAKRDFVFLVGFASRIRSRLDVFYSYVSTFLAGMSIHRPHVAPALHCHLPLLDRGSETSAGFIKLIAEFAAIPMNDEVRQLRLASSRLRVFGY